MSRGRPIRGLWFDNKKNDNPATDEQLELLAAETDTDLDDLFEVGLSQGEVIAKLRENMGDTIPPEVIARREAMRQVRHRAKDCRICGTVGDSTQHHFINRWILKQLDGYQHKWASRTFNCIPICISCHRGLHSRSEGSHSIWQYLDRHETRFAHRAIQALYDERPRLWLLIASGDTDVYETRLMRDWLDGRFKVD